MRPALLLSTLALTVAGCGRVTSPREAGDFTAVRLTRDVPAHARLRAEDLLAITVPAMALPAHETYPREISEVLGATANIPLPAGLVVRDEHFDPYPVIPDSGAGRLRPGELGLVAPLAGITRKTPVDSCLRVQGSEGGLRLAAVSEPAPGVRSAILAAPRDRVLALVRKGLRLPLRCLGPATEGCGAPTSTRIPQGDESRRVLVARRDLARGEIPSREDLEERQIPRTFLPAHPLDQVALGDAGPLLHPVGAGQPLWRALVGSSGATGAPTTLFARGLHPDWVHPGAVVYYLRATSPDPPEPLLVLDVERAARGTPTPLRVQPLPGHDWPSSRRRTGSEGGNLRWVLLLQR